MTKALSPTSARTRSHWKKIQLPRFSPLGKALNVDVLVIGGGMTGISTAYLIKKAGRSVALIERDHLAQQDTANTTAHLTCVTDLRLKKLVKTFGRDHAQAVWDAGLAAIDQIEANVRAESISCEFTRVPGFLFAAIDGEDDETGGLKEDAQLANELGFSADFVPSVPLFNRPGVRFANQAKFHPLKYLAGLVQRIPGDGCDVFEETEAKEFEQPDTDGPIRVNAGGHSITCNFVVVATDVPLTGVSNLVGATLLQSKLAPYTSYVVGAKLPKGMVAEASFWDTSDPYYYLRVDRHRDHDYAVFGGLDHKTGQEEDTQGRFDDLERVLLRFLPDAQIDAHWSGQVIESQDGLPLIGETVDRQFVATGYSGNGITFGTLAAMMARDRAMGRRNPWSDLFDPNRLKLKGGTWNYLRENLDYPYYMIKDRLVGAEGQSLGSLPRGQGMILKLDGKRVAAYRDSNGRTTVLSPVCPHMGCIVHWNEAETTWDCPCHGSRFRCTGEVLAGPAERALEPIKVTLGK